MNISDDPRLTAYVLDELDRNGRNFIENEMECCNECRFEARELADFTDRLRAALVTEPMPELAPKRERAIAARLKQTGVQRKPFWVPIAANWLLRIELTLLVVVLAIWCVPIPTSLSTPVAKIIENASQHTARVMLQAMGTRVEWHGSSLYLSRPAPIVPPSYSSKSTGRVMIDIDCSPLWWITILLVASFMGGNLYLRSLWRKLTLVAAVIPLVLLSDALRKFVVAEWLLHTDGAAVVFPLFRVAQPFFVVFSLLALMPFLISFRKSEKKQNRVEN